MVLLGAEGDGVHDNSAAWRRGAAGATDASLRLHARDWRLIAIAVAVAAVSLWVVSRYFHRAFPQASIDFEVSSATAPTVAQRFLASQGIVPSGFRHAQQFGYDNAALTFLERELGLPRTEALLKNRLHLWRWQNRWFQPLRQEEFEVSISARGQRRCRAPGVHPRGALGRWAALLWLGRLTGAHSGAQLAQLAIFSALALVFVLSFGFLFLRDNPIAYLSAALVPALVLPAAQWLQVPLAAARTAGFALLAWAVIWLVWLGWHGGSQGALPLPPNGDHPNGVIDRSEAVGL